MPISKIQKIELLRRAFTVSGFIEGIEDSGVDFPQLEALKEKVKQLEFSIVSLEVED